MKEASPNPGRVSQMSGSDIQNHGLAMRQAFDAAWQQTQQNLAAAYVTLDAAFDTGVAPVDISEPLRPSAQSFPVYSFQPRESQAPKTHGGFNYLPLYLAEVGANAALQAESAIVHGTIFHAI